MVLPDSEMLGNWISCRQNWSQHTAEEFGGSLFARTSLSAGVPKEIEPYSKPS